jgi:hypothetical protein
VLGACDILAFGKLHWPLAQKCRPTAHVQPKAATSIYCIARANAVAGKEAQQMATVAVPGASNNPATGTWAAMTAGAAVSVAGPATSRICPTTAAKKVQSDDYWNARCMQHVQLAVQLT